MTEVVSDLGDPADNWDACSYTHRQTFEHDRCVLCKTVLQETNKGRKKGKKGLDNSQQHRRKMIKPPSPLPSDDLREEASLWHVEANRKRGVCPTFYTWCF